MPMANICLRNLSRTKDLGILSDAISTRRTAALPRPHDPQNRLDERDPNGIEKKKVIAGLDEDGTPYITGMDSLGAMEMSKDFMVAGTAPNSLWGVCESFYRPDLGPDDLFETISQCLLSGVDRDALSGWGAVVYVM